MRLEYYLKRNKVSIENFCELHRLESFKALCEYLRSINIKPPKEGDVKHVFEEKQSKQQTKEVLAKGSIDPKAKSTKRKSAGPKTAKRNRSSSTRSETSGRPRKSSSSGGATSSEDVDK